MDTPQPSRSPSPSPSADAAAGTERPPEPLDGDSPEDDGQLYEWQFDLLNNLPREKAIALVDKFRHSERERANSAAALRRVSRQNSELQQKLEAAKVGQSVPVAPSNVGDC